MLCAATFKSGANCNYNAKFSIEFENKTYFMCGKHVLNICKTMFNQDFKLIEDIPNLIKLERSKPKANNKLFMDAIAVIKATTNLIVEENGKLDQSEHEVEHYPVKIGNEKLILTICKSEPLMTDLYEAMCIEVQSASKNKLFVPLKQYDVLGKKYYVAKLLHSVDKDKYFYQLKYPSFSLRNIDWTSDLLEIFAERMCSLIHDLHSVRMCFGDFNYHNLLLLKENEVNTVCLKSANDITFWINTHGEFKSEDRLHIGTNIPLTACRRVHSKKAPCRYDDFESLLYFILVLKKIILPWDNLSSLKDITKYKESFLQNPQLYIQINNISAVNSICQIILNVDYEERPIYPYLSKLIIDIARSE